MAARKNKAARGDMTLREIQTRKVPTVIQAMMAATGDRAEGLSQTQREIAEVCEEVRDFLILKNKAYGDSALRPVRILSRSDNVEQLKVRIDDKLSRLQNGHALPDESLADTVNDLLGYLVLLKIATKRRLEVPGLRV